MPFGSDRWGGPRPAPYKHDAVDADNDGIVQEGTVWERPGGARFVSRLGEIIRSAPMDVPLGAYLVDENGEHVDYVPRRRPDEPSDMGTPLIGDLNQFTANPIAVRGLAPIGTPSISEQNGTTSKPIEKQPTEIELVGRAMVTWSEDSDEIREAIGSIMSGVVPENEELIPEANALMAALRDTPVSDVELLRGVTVRIEDLPNVGDDVDMGYASLTDSPRSADFFAGIDVQGRTTEARIVYSVPKGDIRAMPSLTNWSSDREYLAGPHGMRAASVDYDADKDIYYIRLEAVDGEVPEVTHTEVDGSEIVTDSGDSWEPSHGLVRESGNLYSYNGGIESVRERADAAGTTSFEQFQQDQIRRGQLAREGSPLWDHPGKVGDGLPEAEIMSLWRSDFSTSSSMRRILDGRKPSPAYDNDSTRGKVERLKEMLRDAPDLDREQWRVQISQDEDYPVGHTFDFSGVSAATDRTQAEAFLNSTDVYGDIAKNDNRVLINFGPDARGIYHDDEERPLESIVTGKYRVTSTRREEVDGRTVQVVEVEYVGQSMSNQKQSVEAAITDAIAEPKKLRKPFKYSVSPEPMSGRAAELADESATWGEFREKLRGETIIAFDYETTGFPDKDGKGSNTPVEIGAVKIVDGVEVDRFRTFINPGEASSEWAQFSRDTLVDDEGNPLSDEFLSGQPTIGEAHQLFVDFMGEDAILMAHNLQFDQGVLERMLGQEGIGFEFAGGIDTLQLSRDILEGEDVPSRKLGDLSAHYGIELENAHSADADTDATVQLLDKLLVDASGRDVDVSLLSSDVQKRRAGEREAHSEQKYQDALRKYDAAALSELRVKNALEVERLSKREGLPPDGFSSWKDWETSRAVPEGAEVFYHVSVDPDGLVVNGWDSSKTGLGIGNVGSGKSPDSVSVVAGSVEAQELADSLNLAYRLGSNGDDYDSALDGISRVLRDAGVSDSFEQIAELLGDDAVFYDADDFDGLLEAWRAENPGKDALDLYGELLDAAESTLDSDATAPVQNLQGDLDRFRVDNPPTVGVVEVRSRGPSPIESDGFESRFNSNDVVFGDESLVTFSEPIQISTDNFVALIRAKYPNAKIDFHVKSAKDSEGNPIAVLSRIVIPEEDRGQGQGSAFMQDLNDWADENGVTVSLTPSGDFGGSVPRLKKFYAEFGYMKNSGSDKDYAISETMYRLPEKQEASGEVVSGNQVEIQDWLLGQEMADYKQAERMAEKAMSALDGDGGVAYYDGVDEIELSPLEVVQAYTADGWWEDINPSLRLDDDSVIAFRNFGDDDPERLRVAELDRIIEEGSPDVPFVTYRGVGLDALFDTPVELSSDQVEERLLELAGSVIQDDAYMSTSLNPATAAEFADTFKGGGLFSANPRVMFKIRVPVGADSFYIGGTPASYEAEQEVLLGRGSKLRVVGIVARIDPPDFVPGGDVSKSKKVPSTFIVEVEVVK